MRIVRGLYLSLNQTRVENNMASPTVSDCMAMKVTVVDVSDSVLDAARKMIDGNVGCVVAMQQNDIAGIVTKGDILKNSVLKQLDLTKTRVSTVMSTPVISVDQEATLEDAAKIMSERHVSKLPVLNTEGLMVGIITLTDVIRVEPEYVKYLEDLIHSKSSPTIRSNSGS